MMKRTNLFAKGQVRRPAAPVIPRLRVTLASAMLTLLGTMAANAVGTAEPVVFVNTPAIVMPLENVTTNAAIAISAPNAWSTPASLHATYSVLPAGIIDKVTWTTTWTAINTVDPLFGKTLLTNNLIIKPTANASGSATITFIAWVGTVTNTTTIPVSVVPVNQPPSFTSTNIYLVAENSGAAKVTKFLYNLSPGPSAWEKTQIYDFTVTETSGGAGNVVMSSAPQIDASGTLYFQPAPNSYGTNTVTVVMTDNGGRDNGGVDSYTNSFILGVVKTTDVAPVIDIVTLDNVSIPQGQSTNVVVYVSSKASPWGNLTLTATPNNKDVTVTVGTPYSASPAWITTATNVAAFPLQLTAGAIIGTANIALKASDGVLSSAAQTFNATVQAATQPPSFVLSAVIALAKENQGIVTNKSFLKTLSPGPASQSKLLWGFTCNQVSSNDWTNVLLASMTLSNYAGTNLNGTTNWNKYTNSVNIDTNGNLLFMPANNSFGTNLIQVVMTNNGDVSVYGGNNAYTNYFLIGVTPVAVATNTGSLLNIVAQDVVIPEHSPAFVMPGISVYGTNTNGVFQLYAYSSNANIVSLSAPLASADTQDGTLNLYPTFGTNFTNFTLTLNPNIGAVGGTFGTNTVNSGPVVIGLVATDGVNTNYSFFKVTITPVNDAPGLVLATNLAIIYENVGEVASNNFVKTFSVSGAGYSDQAGQTLGFTVITNSPWVEIDGSTNALNVQFAITNLYVTPAGLLTFSTPANVHGTNLITLVLTNSGSTANGGLNSFTTNFELVIMPDHPTFTTNVNPLVIVENAGAVTKTIVTSTLRSVSDDVDPMRLLQTIGLVVTNSATYVSPADNVTIITDPLKLSLSPTVVNPTNGSVQFTTPLNQYGTNTVQVVMEVFGGTNNYGTNWYTNSFLLEIPQDQPRIGWNSAKLIDNILLVIPENAGAISTNIADAAQIVASTNNPATAMGGTNLVLSLSQSYTSPADGVTVITDPVNLGISNLRMDQNGKLTFTTPVNKYGTNNVTVVMQVTNSLGGMNTFTTNFVLGIEKDQPSISWAYNAGSGASHKLANYNMLIVPEGYGFVSTNFLASSTPIEGSVNWVNEGFSGTNFVLSLSQTWYQGTASLPVGDPTKPVNDPVNLGITNLNLDINGNLTFTTPQGVYGTNLVNVTMYVTNSVGGVNSSTTSFVLGIMRDNPLVTWAYNTGAGTAHKLGYYNMLIVPENSGTVTTNFLATFSSTPPLAGIMASTNAPTTSFNGTNISATASQTWYVGDASYPTGDPSLPVSDINLGLTGLSMDMNGLVTFTVPTNVFGTNLVTIVMQVTNQSGGPANTFTTSFALGVAAEDTSPIFSLSSTNYNISQYGVPISISHIIAGGGAPGSGSWENTQTVTYAVAPLAGSPASTPFSYFTVQPALAAGPVGSNLTFTANSTAVGQTVTITIVATDNGSGGINTSSRTLTLNFEPTTTYSALQGTYSGLYFDPANLGFQSAGYVTLVVDQYGEITSGSLINGTPPPPAVAFDGAAHTWSFTGAFDATYPDTAQALTTSDAAEAFHLNLAFDTATLCITGSVANITPTFGFVPVPLTARLQDTTAAAAIYNTLVLGTNDPTAGTPMGDGYLSLTVANPGGTVTLGAAKLADSSTLLGLKAPVMCTNGYYPVYSITTGAGLYGKANALFGWLQFTNIDNLVQLPSGSSLVWLVSPNTIVGQSYNAGFTNVAEVVGSAFTALAAAPYAYGWTIIGDVTSAPGGTPLINEATLGAPASSKIAITQIDGGADALTGLVIHTATGVVDSGTFKGTVGTPAINGLFIPSLNSAGGFFMDNGTSGEFLLIGIAQ